MAKRIVFTVVLEHTVPLLLSVCFYVYFLSFAFYELKNPFKNIKKLGIEKTFDKYI